MPTAKTVKKTAMRSTSRTALKPAAKKTVKPPTSRKAKAVSEPPAKPAKKKPVVEELVVQEIPKMEEELAKDKKSKYLEAIGRRKTAVARVRLYTQGKKEVLVNGKNISDYFKTPYLQEIVLSPLEKLKCADKFGLSIIVKGGGMSSQAGACRLGLARTLILLNPYFKKRMKKSGLLTRDPRMRERKKFGLKRARRAPQWSKR